MRDRKKRKLFWSNETGDEKKALQGRRYALARHNMIKKF